MKNILKVAGAASVLAMAVASVTAVADPLTELGFQQNAGWDATAGTWSFDGSNGLSGLDFDNLVGGDAPANTYADMSWNDANNHNNGAVHTSSINIQGFTNANSPTSTGVVSDPSSLPIYPADANGQWNEGESWIITELAQTNQVLHASGFPDPTWVADALANFYVTSADGATEYLADENSATTIEFWETRNALNSDGECNSPAPLGTVCDDIYRVAAIALAPISFDDGDYRYTIGFGLLPGPNDVDGVSLVCTTGTCAGVDVPVGQIWVFTNENSPGNSSLFVTASWTAELIPEPSVLALLGIGVLGAGFASRRRKQA